MNLRKHILTFEQDQLSRLIVKERLAECGQSNNQGHDVSAQAPVLDVLSDARDLALLQQCIYAINDNDHLHLENSSSPV